MNTYKNFFQSRKSRDFVIGKISRDPVIRDPGIAIYNYTLSVLLFSMQYDWLVVQVHTKDVLKCFIAVSGEPFVTMDSLVHQRESFVTCSDTGRLLSHVHSCIL